MECKLCGLPTPSLPIEADGHPFCCLGCKEVFIIMGPDALVKKSTEKLQTPVEKEQANRGKECFLRIEGMHCASCELLIERTVNKVDGIFSVVSSYATSTAKIIYNPDVISENDLPVALKMHGYKVRLSSDETPEYDDRLDLQIEFIQLFFTLYESESDLLSYILSIKLNLLFTG